MDTESDLFLTIEHFYEEDDDYLENEYSRRYLKVLSNMDSLKSCKEFNDETPIYLELSDSLDYIHYSEIGFSLTIEQAENVIEVLSSMVGYLKQHLNK